MNTAMTNVGRGLEVHVFIVEPIHSTARRDTGMFLGSKNVLIIQEDVKLIE